jgi:hypothetical protein
MRGREHVKGYGKTNQRECGRRRAVPWLESMMISRERRYTWSDSTVYYWSRAEGVFRLKFVVDSFDIRWFVLLGMALACHVAAGQSWTAPSYPSTNAVWQDIWVSAATGHDGNSGDSSNQALRSISAAWAKIPALAPLVHTGYRVRILPGDYRASTPSYWENRWGSETRPILFQAEGTNWSARLSDITVFNCSHLYFAGIHFEKAMAGGDGLQIERGSHILLRDCKISGRNLAHEGLKVNQSQHMYVERCDISGAGDNAVDFVAVQFGHIIHSRVYDAGDWVMYVKGGSAYIRIDGNEVFDSSGNGGITAGQGTGFEWMTYPWLHYEAYDVKIVNNYIHDTFGAGMGVNGGYNILLAYNTLVRVGARSHVIEFVHGNRSCDGHVTACESNRLAGGWGGVGGDDQYIPNRNVYLFNNIVYNPSPYRSEWQHFSIARPVVPPAGSNVSSPSRADVNLLIRGNIIWNGPAGHEIGGCTYSTGTCHDLLIDSENYINLFEPQFVSVTQSDFRPAIEGNIYAALAYPVPDFPGGDRPAVPVTPAGLLGNAVPGDRTGAVRYSFPSVPGCYLGGAGMRIQSISPDEIGLLAEQGYVYSVESSRDFRAWTRAGVITAATKSVSVPIAEEQRHAFFRVRLLP